MAGQGQGQQQMTQEELNDALFMACGHDNDQARAEELLGRGADQHALAYGGWNALHLAARWGREKIVAMLLSRGAVLEARSDITRLTALLLAALEDKPEVCLLLIAKGADLRVRDKYNNSALSLYGLYAPPRLDPSVKAQRVAELKAAFRTGCHPSQVQRRMDENWAKRWPLMNAAYGSGFLVLESKAAQLMAAALPTDAKIPDEPTATGAERRALRHKKVFGHAGLVRRIASFIQDKERGEEEEEDIWGREQRRLFVCEKRE